MRHQGPVPLGPDKALSNLLVQKLNGEMTEKKAERNELENVAKTNS